MTHHNLSLRTAYETIKPLDQPGAEDRKKNRNPKNFLLPETHFEHRQNLGVYMWRPCICLLRPTYTRWLSTKQGRAAFRAGVSQYYEGGCNDV